MAQITPSEIINPLGLTAGAGSEIVVTFDATTGQALKSTLETTVTDDDEKIPTSGALVDYAMQKITPADGYLLQSDENGQAESTGIPSADVVVDSDITNMVTSSATLTPGNIITGAGTKTVGDSGKSTEYLLPVGTILPFSDDAIPSGFLECNGSVISRTTYANLFSLLGTTWGIGDGSTTFNLPDLVGATPAGSGTSTGYTQNETITFATKHNDQFQGHIHDETIKSTSTVDGSYAFTSKRAAENTGQDFKTSAPETDGSNGTPRIGNSTRGKLVGVKYIIKY